MIRNNYRNAKPLRAVPARKSRVKKNRNMLLYKHLGTMVPPEFETELKYIVQYLFGAPGANLDSLRFTNNAYDVDPTLGSTAMAGFSEFAGFYQRFRTMGIGYRIGLINKEAFPVSIIHGVSAVSIASGSLGMNYGENPNFSTSILGAATGSSTMIVQRKVVPITKIVGSKQPLYDDVYTGSTTSSTLAASGTVWAYIGASANGLAGGFVASVIANVCITLRIRFYRPTFIVT